MDYLIQDLDWSDESISVDMVDEREIWQAKRQADIDYCMKMQYVENPKTGRNHWQPKPCGEPDCPKCGPQIREELRAAIEEILEDRPLRLVRLTGSPEEIDKQRAQLIRKYGGKKKVSAFPNDILTENGFGVELDMLIDTEEEVGEAYTRAATEDIERWARKSFYLKKSGSLHKKCACVASCTNDLDDPWQGYEEIEYESWLLDTKDKDVIREIEKEVILTTLGLVPTTIQELREAMRIRRQRRKELLAEKGIVILSNKLLIMHLKMEKVDWSLSQDQLKIFKEA